MKKTIMAIVVCLASAVALLTATAGNAPRAEPVDELVAPETLETVDGLTAALQRIRAERDELLKTLEQREARMEAIAAERDTARDEAQALAATVGQLEQRLSALEAERVEAAAGEADLRRQLEAAVTATRQDRVTLAYNIGCVYKATGEYARAEREFLRALQLAPDDAAIHFNLGILYDDHLDNRDKARTHYERFLELAPDDPDVPRVVQWLTVL